MVVLQKVGIIAMMIKGTCNLCGKTRDCFNINVVSKRVRVLFACEECRENPIPKKEITNPELRRKPTQPKLL
jgi:hypothetical protein